MKIAIVGTGISGLVAAYVLSRKHDITVYEASDRVGGHAHTVNVEQAGARLGVDTGFVVFNEQAYPNFVQLLRQLRVPSQSSDMSFSVRCASSKLEYASHSINGLFGQRSNAVRPGFIRMLLDIRRFFREAREVLNDNFPKMTLDEYLSTRNYSQAFIRNHLIPMGSAIWSANPTKFHDFPIQQFVKFFDNHGFLQVRNRPGWRTVTGGSQSYVEAITRTWKSRIRLNSPVCSIKRNADGVRVATHKSGYQDFDRVVIAAHSDQALRMLHDASDKERTILGAIPYQPNHTVLHTDDSVLPKRQNCWASWNYHKTADEADPVSITYCMNRLQSLRANSTFCVTLNNAKTIDQKRVIKTMDYHHPIYDDGSFAAQQEWPSINGVRNTYYCGAYWGYGFHEDGVRSALRVCREFRMAM